MLQEDQGNNRTLSMQLLAFSGFHSNREVFISNSLATAIIFHSSYYYVFYPRNRAPDGLPAQNSVSILMQFRSLSQVERYIRKLRLSYKNIQQLWYHVRFIEPLVSEAVENSISTDTIT